MQCMMLWCGFAGKKKWNQNLSVQLIISRKKWLEDYLFTVKINIGELLFTGQLLLGSYFLGE